MTQHDDLDRLLTAWLDDPYTPPAPRYLTQVLERTRRTRQRPAWTNLERWIPMADKVLPSTAAPPMRMARLLLIVILVLALAAAAAVVGSRLLSSTPAIPQGGSAVFAFGSISGQAARDIFTVRADGSDLRQLTTGPGVKSQPAFSPDGTHIAYRSWQDGTDSIVVIDAGGGHPTTVASTSASQADCARGRLAWSPDGKSLIFPTNEFCDTQVDLFIVASDGSSRAARLIAAGTNSVAAAWSPDAKRIAFLGSGDGGSVGTYVAEPYPDTPVFGGFRPHRIGPGPAGPLAEAKAGPQWSPDGTQLVSTNEAGGIYLMQADGSGQRVVVGPADAAAEPVWSPAWSPDGRQIAFYRGADPAERFDDRPCTVRTWVVDLDGTDERRLQPLGDGCDLAVTWSPDGTRLAVLLLGDDPSNGFHLGMITLDGGEPMVTLQDATSGSWQPVVAPLPPAPSFPAP